MLDRVLPLFAAVCLSPLLQAQEPVAAYDTSDPDQQICLPAADKPRFELRDITWPAEVGQAEVCLWQDDKYAAVSITIDDNCAPDVPFWLELAARHDIKLTWFLITERIDKGINAGFNGNWELWSKVKAAGHAVESHSLTHGKNDAKESDEHVTREYAVSRALIEANIPGTCRTIAFPRGSGKTAVSTQYYIACRGVDGHLNEANRINYAQTMKGNTDEGFLNVILGGRAETPKWINRPEYKRGWACRLYHFVGSGTDKEAAQHAAVEKHIEGIVARRDRLWIDTFTAVAQYGQERDSARLETVSSSDEGIELTLTDRMHDQLFDLPLTIKVRLPQGWTAVQATQNGSAIAATLVEHEGAPYALVQAVPDRGRISLSPAG